MEAAHAELAPVTELTRELERGEHRRVESFVMIRDGEQVGRYVAPAFVRKAPDLRSATKSL